MGIQSSVAPRAGTTPSANPIMSFAPMIVICLILYFLLIRPQQKQAKEHKALVDSLKTGDRVLTQGGVYGTVVSIKGGIVQLKLAEGRIDVARSAITQVLPDSPTAVVETNA